MAQYILHENEFVYALKHILYSRIHFLVTLRSFYTRLVVQIFINSQEIKIKRMTNSVIAILKNLLVGKKDD